VTYRQLGGCRHGSITNRWYKMCRNPLYFFKSKHGVYQFRYSLPLSLFNKYKIQREIKISLRTKQRDIAIRRHYIVLSQMNLMIRVLDQFIMTDSTTTTKTLQDVIDNHKKKIIVDELRDDNMEQSLELISLRAQLKESENIIKSKDLTINSLSTGNTQPLKLIKKSITIAEAIAEYFTIQAEQHRWKENVKRQRKGYFGVFSDIIGKFQDISVLDKDRITYYQRTLRKIPKNVNKFYIRPDDVKKRPDFYKNIVEIHDKPLLSARGLESHFNTVKPFLTWCVENEYLQKDYRHLLSIGKGEIRKTGTKVLPFSQDHLTSMFTNYIYSDHLLPREKPNPFQFWMPLLGLWTGARENEIASLLLSDIKTIDGIICIDINENGEGKSLKNEHSKRKVPIAQTILNAGFESYVEQRRQESKTNKSRPSLFILPDHRDGIARAVSKWFNDNFKKKCKLTTTGNTTVNYHSFRHTFIDKMNSTKIGKDLVATRIMKEIVGHEAGDVTNGVYVTTRNYALHKEVIDCLDFNVDMSELSYERFLARRKYKKK